MIPDSRDVEQIHGQLRSEIDTSRHQRNLKCGRITSGAERRLRLVNLGDSSLFFSDEILREWKIP